MGENPDRKLGWTLSRKVVAPPYLLPSDILVTYPGAVMNERKTRLGTVKHFDIGVWNLRGVAHKKVELQRELKLMDVDIVIIPETKKKHNSSTELD